MTIFNRLDITMELFHGKNLVQTKLGRYSAEEIIHSNPSLLIVSKHSCIKMDLPEQQKLFLWGRIHALLNDDGDYLPVLSQTDLAKQYINLVMEKDPLEAATRFEGEFVGCHIIDDEQCFIFSDRFNRRDIFYCYTQDGLIAATNLAPMSDQASSAYDQTALVNMLCIFGGYAPKKHTIYQNIRRLGVGERLILSANQPRIDRIPFIPLRSGDYGANELEQYARLLTDAVKIRASQKCTWVYLSGGWDSSSLVTLLANTVERSRIKSVTGRIALSPYSRDTNVFEADRAKAVADFFDIEAHEVPWDLTSSHGVDTWNKMRPFFQLHHVYSKNSADYCFQAEYIKKYAFQDDIIFSGEICDGVHNLGFASSRTIQDHPVLDFRIYADKMAAYLFGPTFLGSIIDGTYSRDAVYHLLRSRLAGHVFEDDEKNLTQEERIISFLSSCFIRSHRIPFYSLKNHAFLTEAGAQLYQAEMEESYLYEAANNLSPENVYSWLLYLYNSFHWQGSTIKSIAAAAEYYNLHVTHPYWDRKLQSFLSTIPENWGRGLELRPIKYPLKWMLQNKFIYPHQLQQNSRSFLNDVDPTFSFQKELLFRSALAPHFKNRLKDYPFEEVLDPECFKIDYFRQLVDKYVSGMEVTGKELADLDRLVLFCWVGWL